MKSKIARCFKSCFSLVISLSLVFGLIGCSPSGDQHNNTGADVTGSPDAEVISDTVPDDARISDNGQPIYDFDEFVNGEWKEQHKNGDCTYTADDDVYNLYFTRIKDIIENTDLSTLDEESGLYKVVKLYQEIMDTSDTTQRMDTIKTIIDEIEGINDLSDLCALYSSEIFVCNEFLFRFEVGGDDYGYNCLFYSPISFTDKVKELKETLADPQSDEAKYYLYPFNELGFSEERVDEILNNCIYISSLIDSYYEQHGYMYAFWDEEKLADSGVEFPVFNILRSQPKLGNTVYFYADANFPDFVNTVFVPENLQALKDCQIYSFFWIFGYLGYDRDFGYDSTKLSDNTVHLLMYYAPDVIAREYMNRYGSDELIKEINSLILDVKKAEISIVNDCDWLEEESKEAVKQKMSRMTQYIGENGHKNLLPDFELTGNAIDDLLSLKVLYYTYCNEQIYYDYDSRAPFGNNVTTVNAVYNADYNCLSVYPAYICDPSFTETDSYEEKLAFIGIIIAHEIGHAIDRTGIDHNWEGIYEPFLTEEEAERYNSEIQNIIEYFDNMKCEFDNQIPGEIVVNESVADIIALETCLRVLAEREDVDYDLFFRTYAESKAAFYIEDDFDYYLNEEHLTAKPRINCILGQFDEFYETYNIDESGPYFVPENERLRIF